MINYESRCCNCATSSYPCIGATCPNLRVKVYYCDICEEEITGELIETENGDFCRDCYDEIILETIEE